MEKEKLMSWLSVILGFCFLAACFGLGHAALRESNSHRLAAGAASSGGVVRTTASDERD